MPKLLFLLFVTSLLWSLTPVPSPAAVRTDAEVPAAEAVWTKKQLRKQRRQAKRAERWQQRLEKRAEKLRGKGKSIWDDGLFRFGVILLLAALAIAIIAAIGILTGFFNVIAAILALGGIVFMLIALFDYL